MSTSESTAVTTTEGADAQEWRSDQFSQIALQGKAMVDRDRAIRAVYKDMQALEWGKALSPHTKAVLAGFCVDVGANLAYHVDNLGGKPYLNANYWSDRINGEPHYMGHEQVNISADPDARAEWGVPEWAQQAVVTTIRRLANIAPIEAIRAGRVTDLAPYLYTVAECNWAGGRPSTDTKKDPIGNAEPAKTARTRSLRRCAARAFEAIRIETDAMVKRAEETLRAEWEQEFQRQQEQQQRFNPNGLPRRQLVSAATRDERGNPAVTMVDPALVKEPRTASMPPRGVSQAQHEEDLRRAQVEEPEEQDAREAEDEAYAGDIFGDPA